VITTRMQGDLKLMKQLQVLAMPPAKRKKFHREVTRLVIREARANTKAQRTVTGEAFAPRINKKKKKPLLKNVAKAKNLKAYVGPNSGKVTWPNSLSGKIARAQQEGHTETMTAGKMKKIRGVPDYDAPATKAQAKALLQAGFRRPTGKYKSGVKKGQTKSRRVSSKWIMENMTLGKAALVLRILLDKKTKASWPVTVKARPFFGLRKADVNELSDRLIKNILTDVKRAA